MSEEDINRVNNGKKVKIVCSITNNGEKVVVDSNIEKLTFQVGDLDYKHEIGNPNCTRGWCGTEYPRPCEKCGKGLVHADFGDENHDGYWLYTKCDYCGESE